MKLNVGMIGAGMVSRVHLHAYQQNENATVISVADVDEKRRTDVAKEFGISQAHEDYRALLENKKIDLVDVCLPHYLHHQVVCDAFQAGKDVICEKPIAMNLKEADEMIAEARKQDKRFFIALNQRFIPGHQKIREMLAEKTIGNPFLCLMTVIGDELARMQEKENWKGSWEKAGGGVLADTGTHLIDITHYFFGNPRKITCVARQNVLQNKAKGDDNTVVALEYEANLLVNITLTYAATSDPWSERKSIYGTEGSLHFINEADKPLWLVRDKGQPEYIKVEPFDRKLYNSWWEHSVANVVHHFVDCIVNDKEPIVTPQDARQTLRTILLAYEAAREGRTISA